MGEAVELEKNNESVVENIQEAIALFENNYKIDFFKPSKILNDYKNAPGFDTWGLYAWIKAFDASGVSTLSAIVSEHIYKKHPDFIQVWPNILRTNKGTKDYHRLATAIFNCITSMDLSSAPWLKGALIEAMIFENLDKSQEVLTKMAADAVIDKDEAAFVAQCAQWAENFRNDLSHLNLENIKYYRFGIFGATTKTATVENDIVHINLSPIHAKTMKDGFELTLGILREAIASSLGSLTPMNDDGVSSWPYLQEEDKFNALVWRYLDASDEGRSRPRFRAAEKAVSGLCVRAGNVELNALYSYLLNKDEMLEAVVAACESLAEAKERGQEPDIHSEAWWPRLSPFKNARFLCMYAGWHSDVKHAKAAFSDWADRYLDALCEDKIIIGHTRDFMKVAALEPRLRTKQHVTFNDDVLLNSLANRRLALISPFADEIQAHYDAGILGNLWKKLGIESQPKSLVTAPSIMSIWPYAPTDSWSDSFRMLCDRAGKIIEESNADYFLSSSGCYGLPLSLEMYRRYGIQCLYYGHATNMFFGVSTMAFNEYGLFKNNSGLDEWLKPDLTRNYSAVARVDGGRYAQS